MTNCQNELTTTDLDLLTPGTVQVSYQASASQSLFPYISSTQSTGLNLLHPEHLPRILRPLDSKDVAKTNDELIDSPEELGQGGVWGAGCVDSQVDDEIIIRVAFTELVRIKSILIGTGGGRLSTSPRRVKVFVNHATGISFDDIENDLKPDQEWELFESPSGGRGSVEYPVKIVRFGNVHSVDFYFSDSTSRDLARLFYLGFMGESSELKRDPKDRLTVGAEHSVHKGVEGVRELKQNGNAVR